MRHSRYVSPVFRILTRKAGTAPGMVTSMVEAGQ